jgi:drug/metabolite transporter (DMT)-like permease
MSSETNAILLRLLAAALATGLGACVHGAAQYAPVGQIVFFRAALSIPPILFYAALTAPLSDLRPRAPRAHIMRGLFGGLAMILNFTALSFLPVAHASALGYLAPILTLPVAVIMLGERVSVRLVLAVAMGFAGVIAMLYTSLARPDWGAGQVIGIAAGFASAATMALVRVQIKAMTRTEPVPAIALTFAIITSCIGLVSIVWGNWVGMSPVLWVWLGSAGVLGGLTHIAATEATARAPVSTLAPFDYTGLIWAVLLDVILFANVPGLWGYVGMGLITGAALLVILGPKRRDPPTSGLTLR